MKINKFRAWDPAFGVMHMDAQLSQNAVQDDRGYFLSTSAIVMQWTGLRDKNGNEVYEGDRVVVREFTPEHSLNSKPCDELIGVVKYSTRDAAYLLQLSEDDDAPLTGEDMQIEVLGHMYESIDPKE